VIRRLAALLALLLVASCAGPMERSVAPELATTDVGRLRGIADGDVVRFRGVPYAAAPVGERRWAPPEPVAPWPGEREAIRSGAPCAQAAADVPEGSTAEDCLYLDVTAPAPPGNSRPVMVWLHGGGFTGGSGSEFDPRRMAVEGGAVVVTVDFRLGIMGYLALSGMPGGGTFGLADQQEALRFLRRNAAAFGGDPRNITVFGESGGGIAVCAQLTSPPARGLFDRAILQSAGPCVTDLPPGGAGRGAPAVSFWRSLADVEDDGLRAAARLGCPDPTSALACLRELPVERVLTEHTTFAAAAVGGKLLPTDPHDALRAGDVAPVPVLTGFNRDESRLMAGAMALLGQPIRDEEYPDLITAGFGDRAADVLQQYPLDRYTTGAEAWAAVHTDRGWACPQLIANDALALHTPVHAYEFADRTAPPYIPFLPGALNPGAAHASELAYLFDVADKPIDIHGNRVPLTVEQLALSSRMIRSWTEFARTGDSGGPQWRPDTRKAMSFGGAFPVGRPWTQHRCDFWAAQLS
jgi:para-nitrobenzyl esterase